MYDIEEILDFPLISQVFGWPLLTPKGKEIPKKGLMGRLFFPRFSGGYSVFSM